MPETERCPSCGATNPVGAAWCGQCLRRFAPPAAPAEPPAAAPSPAAGASAAAKATAPGARAAETPGAVGVSERFVPDAGRAATGGPFVVSDEGITWKCARCGTDNDLSHYVCDVCGATFGDLVREPPPERPKKDAGTAALVSLFMPGAGHGYLGMWGHAVARALVFLWLALVIFIAARQRGVTGSIALAGVFMVAAFGWWVAAAHDAYREASDQSALVLLKGRHFLFVVLGLLVLLVVMMLPAILSVR